uniref:semaphorin-7A-like n=1 Tax=Pristiophorus japonicus TaxID=55135 RepID=UPI00398F8CB8
MAASRFLLSLLLSSISVRSSPRLKLDLTAEIQDRVQFNPGEEYTTTLRDGNVVYVGGKAVLYRINFEASPSPVKIPVPGDDTATKKCIKDKLDHCGNFVMVLQKFNATHILLCGTNAQVPQCWLHSGNELNLIIHGYGRPLGAGVCPLTPKQSVTSLVVEERLYSVAALYSDGNNVLRGFRKADEVSWLLSVDTWMADPKFVGMSPMDDLVYMFFREKNLPANPDIDPWISRIARVCKDDRGGSRQHLQNKWATFLKARLLCNIPTDNVHFNRIEDAFIARSSDGSEDRVYGIFNSNWNASAICVYSMKDISDVFETSTFKGFNENIPVPRPGTCVSDTQGLPDKVLSVVDRYPEMEAQIHPIGKIPLLIKNKYNFKKIVVDSVVGINGAVSRVLFLAMGNGKIQKVLETGQSAFTISELKVLKEPGPIVSMCLDSETKQLYVTTTKELVRFPLAQCDKYNPSCESCVMARDSYCGWKADKKKCVPITPGIRDVVQDLEKCDFRNYTEEKVVVLHTSWRDSDYRLISLPLKSRVPVYLSCPKHSHHADYSWKFNDSKVLDCSSNEDECLLFINDLSKVSVGSYKCISNEGGREQLHKSYLIQDNSESSLYLSSYSAALYSVLMTVAALFSH